MHKEYSHTDLLDQTTSTKGNRSRRFLQPDHREQPQSMPRRRKEGKTPGMMMDFFAHEGHPSHQDSGGGMQRSPRTLGQNTNLNWDTDNNHITRPKQLQTDSQSSSSASSPVKVKQRMVQHASVDTADRDTGSTLDDTLEFQETIAAFPTNNQPVMDSTLKDMLVSLRSAIHTDMLQLMKQCKSEVAEVSDRVTHIESKMRNSLTLSTTW